MATRHQQRGQPPDAIALLKADHQKFRTLFVEYQAAMDWATKRSVATLVFVALEMHAQLEEHVFYPAVHEETADGPALVTARLEEHQTIKQCIQELRGMRPDLKVFDAKFHALIRHVDHHMAAEEAEMFPLAEAELEADMQELRDEMQEFKAQLLAS
jgi:hemerythrin-like domain-containing protein